MRGLFLSIFFLCSIASPWTFLSKATYLWPNFPELLKSPNNKSNLGSYENMTGSEEIRKTRGVIDVSIGSEALSTKFTSGVKTFAAYTGISTSTVSVATIAILAFPFLILLIYFSLVVFFPDPASPVPFERDVAVTVKHLKFMAADMEDRIFDFLEEITDPNQFAQENQPSQSYDSDHSNGYHSSLQNSVPYHGVQYLNPLDSYVQYTSNQNYYSSPVKTIGGLNTYSFNNLNAASNIIQGQMQSHYYPQNPHSKSLVVHRPTNQFQYTIPQEAIHSQNGYSLNSYDSRKETRRVSYDQPNFIFQNGAQGNNLEHPLRNFAFDPLHNVGPVVSHSAKTQNPLIDQRGETPQAIEMQLKALSQLNSNPTRKSQGHSVSALERYRRFHPSTVIPIVPRNAIEYHL